MEGLATGHDTENLQDVYLTGEPVPRNQPHLQPLDPQARSREILENLLARVWNYYLLSAAPGVASYPDLASRHTPGRGLLYSFLLHEIALFLLLMPPAIFQTSIRPRRVATELAWMQPRQRLYLPPLGGGRSGGERAAKSGSAGKPGSGPPKRGTSPAVTVRPRAGVVYPGPQPIVSNPPRPDNRIQTILQPELIRPPKLQVPLALPNLVMIARAPEAPPPPPVPVKLTPKPPLPPPPKPAPRPDPEAPDVQGKVQAQNLLSAIPITPPPAPKVPVKLALPPPAPAPAKASRQADRPPVPVPEPPRLIPTTQMADLSARSVLVLSPIPGPPLEKLSDVPLGEARGQFAISPDANLAVPGESGMGASTATTDLTAGTGGTATADFGTGGSGGSATGEGLAGAGGSGSGSGERGTGAGSGAGSGSGTGSGTSGTGTGNGAGGLTAGAGSGRGTGSGTGEGSGSGAGTGPGEGPFAGITIADGTPGSTMATPPDSRPAPKAPDNSQYGLTIVSTGTTGGGLKDYGIFRNEPVYTVYIDMNHSGTPAPAWILQYALLAKPLPDPAPTTTATTLLSSIRMDTPVQAPFPLEKDTPQFPPAVVARNLGRMVVVYAVINAEGRAEQTRILQSPNPLLNQPLLESLRKWTFRPAEMNGAPVAVKSLFGIILSAAL